MNRFRFFSLAVWLGCGLLSSALFAAENAKDQVEPEPPITQIDREHWAYLPLIRPEVPHVQDSAWPRNAIDRFILAKLEEASLNPLPEADRVTLIRRLSFDLTGLPPTPDAVSQFLHDSSPNAYDRLVDRLLASPEYGVRWGQHWLDLARFAETDGFEHDHVRPNAWRYRDWVINAFNADLPYDQFVQRQIAGDVLEPNNSEALVATGFLLCGPDMPDINLQAERKHTILNELTSTVGSVVLGLPIGCAQCHDHKFDPVSQRDFYRLRAFFENMDIFRDHPLPAPTLSDTERETRLAALETEIFTLEQLAVERSTKAKNGKPVLITDYEALLKKHLTPKEQTQHAELTAKWDALRTQANPVSKTKPQLGRVVNQRTGKPAEAYLWIRGDFRRQGPKLQPGYLRVINSTNETPGKSEAPRVSLARWLTRPNNPLTTRVMANRLWQHHFGKGLSESSSNFGIMGQEPTHSRLLDWLAWELASDWSLKRMHKLIVTSATYRTASRAHNHRWSNTKNALAQSRWKTAVAEDPENQLLARARRRRLEGEAIRDALLFVTETLSQNRGGPGVRPPLPPELLSTLLKNQWPVTKNQDDHTRRSLYLFVRRNLRFPIFEVFDQPDTNASCAVRARSTIAPQALTMLNSTLTHTAAEQLASLVLSKTRASQQECIQFVFQKTLSREPSENETRLALAFLKSQSERTEKTPEIAWRDFCLAILNTNEFLYVD